MPNGPIETKPNQIQLNPLKSEPPKPIRSQFAHDLLGELDDRKLTRSDPLLGQLRNELVDLQSQAVDALSVLNTISQLLDRDDIPRINDAENIIIACLNKIAPTHQIPEVLEYIGLITREINTAQARRARIARITALKTETQFIPALYGALEKSQLDSHVLVEFIKPTGASVQVDEFLAKTEQKDEVRSRDEYAFAWFISKFKTPNKAPQYDLVIACLQKARQSLSTTSSQSEEKTTPLVTRLRKQVDDLLAELQFAMDPTSNPAGAPGSYQILKIFIDNFNRYYGENYKFRDNPFTAGLLFSTLGLTSYQLPHAQNLYNANNTFCDTDALILDQACIRIKYALEKEVYGMAKEKSDFLASAANALQETITAIKQGKISNISPKELASTLEQLSNIKANIPTLQKASANTKLTEEKELAASEKEFEEFKVDSFVMEFITYWEPFSKEYTNWRNKLSHPSALRTEVSDLTDRLLTLASKQNIPSEKMRETAEGRQFILNISKLSTDEQKAVCCIDYFFNRCRKVDGSRPLIKKLAGYFTPEKIKITSSELKPQLERLTAKIDIVIQFGSDNYGNNEYGNKELERRENPTAYQLLNIISKSNTSSASITFFSGSNELNDILEAALASTLHPESHQVFHFNNAIEALIKLINADYDKQTETKLTAHSSSGSKILFRTSVIYCGIKNALDSLKNGRIGINLSSEEREKWGGGLRRVLTDNRYADNNSTCQQQPPKPQTS